METQFYTALPFMLALIMGLFLTSSIIDLAKKMKLFDGNNHLKVHVEKVCSLGGIAIFAAFWVAFLLTGPTSGIAGEGHLFVGSFVLFLTGVKDDLVSIPAKKRLLIQLGVASLLFFGGVQLTQIPGMDFTFPLPVSYFLTIFLMGALVNAFNFIDGINGLAGGLAFIASLAFSLLFFMAGANGLGFMALALAGAVMGFLWFNFGKAKIFMGDNGSTFIGIILSYFCVSFLNPDIQAGFATPVSPVVLLAVLIVPLADLIKVVLSRLVRRQSPFIGDRNHIHHLLERTGLGHRSICMRLFGWNIFVILFSLLLLPQNILLACATIFVAGGLPYLALNIAAYFRKGKKPSNAQMNVRKGEEVFQ
ncbi:MAG: MraY family glycosyltransferase [Saprospiraceae bacterium]